jgi:hypothetical protein
LVASVDEFWRDSLPTFNDHLIPASAALNSTDEVHVEFTQAHNEAEWICDLRGTKVGEGVNLEKLDVIGVHPTVPLLALRKGRSGLARFFLGRREVPAL